MKNFLPVSLLLILAVGCLRAEDNEFLSKVKSLGTQAASSAATGAAGALNKAAGATQAAPSGPDADVLKSIELLKQQVEASMAAFQKSSAPDGEKMKQFDSALETFDAVISMTQQGGSLDQRIMMAVTENQKRISLMRQRSNDTSLSADQREIYNQKIQSFEKQIQQASEKRAVLIRQTAQLMSQRDQILKNKQFYLDMINVQDLEEANKSLDAVISAQSHLVDSLSTLGAKFTTPSSGPAKQ